MHDSAGQCWKVQDSARKCRTVQDNAEQGKYAGHCRFSEQH
jgi:hypothetical protein